MLGGWATLGAAWVTAAAATTAAYNGDDVHSWPPGCGPAAELQVQHPSHHGMLQLLHDRQQVGPQLNLAAGVTMEQLWMMPPLLHPGIQGPALGKFRSMPG